MGACASSPAAVTTATVATTTTIPKANANISTTPNNNKDEGGGASSKTNNNVGTKLAQVANTVTHSTAAAAAGATNNSEGETNDDHHTIGMKKTINNQISSATTPSSPSLSSQNNHQQIPSQDVSVSSNFSVDSSSSHSSSGGGGGGGNSNNNHKPQTDNLSTSHRRRKSRQLTHTDSKVGLTDILVGDIPNPNLVRIEVPLGKPIEEVYEGVHDGPVLGSGITGIVRLVKHRTTQVSYAVKCLELALIDSEEGLKQLKEEIYIMCQLDHPSIVRLEEVYESHSEIYLVQEVCKGGELFDRLDEQPDYHYTEAQCARLVKQMLSSARYIHNKGIIHRDLKLENFLFSDLDADSELKMIDFGLSKHFTFGEVHHEAVGTPYTVAPEVIRGSYDERCDVWAIGVITYLLLSGEPPFGGCGGPETLMQVRDNILCGAFEFEPADIWATVSQEAKDFIKSLLVIDPMDRPTARQAKESKWLQMWTNRENNGEGAVINPNVVKALVGFKEYSDMRKLLCEVLSFTLLPEQIQDLRKEFEKYDQEGTGEITLSTLKKVLIGNASTGSLGGLTEEEVVDIFNAIRVRKTETSIHWHDFIAAGLSQCQVDDRNLRLAFERLDLEHKGYITLEDVMDLMGSDAFETEDQMLNMWGESMRDCSDQLRGLCKHINYEDFVLLMKGQKREQRESGRYLRSSLDQLAVVPEIIAEEDEEHKDSFNANEDSPGSFNPASDNEDAVPVRKPSLVPVAREASPDLSGTPSPGLTNFVRMGSNSAPATPMHYGKRFDEMDSPLSTGGDNTGNVSFNEQCDVFTIPNLDLTPPQTPVRGPSDFITPTIGRATLDPHLLANLTPPDLSGLGLSLPNMFPGSHIPGPSDMLFNARGLSLPNIVPLTLNARGRSISLDEKETCTSNLEAESRRAMMFKRDSRRAMAIPEHTHTSEQIERVIEDKTKTPLVVNRKLYRAHREFRHAVTEACKRFEDEQMRRAKETLRAQENAYAKHTAGLVMRHGQALSEQSIKNFLKKTLEEQQKQADQANRRGGRGRRSRKKTVSDMSGMVGGPAPPAEPNSVAAARKTVGEAKAQEPKAKALAPVKENENLLRNPTKPGEFRKTNYDPFQRKSLLVPFHTSTPPLTSSPAPPPPPPLA